MRLVMFTVFHLTSGHHFAFSAKELDELREKLDTYGMINDGDTYAIMQDGKPYQLWVKASYVSIRDDYKGMDGYQGWFPMSRRKWDTRKGEFTTETYKVPVAMFTGSVGHIYGTFGDGTPREVEVDGIRYRIENVCGNRHVFTLDGTWLGDFITLSDSEGWYKEIHSVRKPTPATYTSPKIEFYPISWRYGNRSSEVKWASSEKGAVRLIVKLVKEFAQAAAK